jgi:oligopeptide transport system permease protein
MKMATSAGLVLVAPAILMALTADLWSRTVSGFTYSEIHSSMALAGPGERDVPERYRTYDGDPSSFNLLDQDDDGLVCLLDGAESSPDLQAANRAFRPCLFGIAEERSNNAKLDKLPPQCLPEDRSNISRGDVIEATRWMRHDSGLLAQFDMDGDNCISLDEYPGAPETRPLLLGADASGRDLTTRLFYGARASLLVALLATILSLMLGTSAGLIAAGTGGRVDRLILRFVDILYGLPLLFIVMLIYLAIRDWTRGLEGLTPEGLSLLQAAILFIALGAIQWPSAARLTRGAALALQARGFIRSAHAMGIHPVRVTIRHTLPHLLPSILAYGVLLVPVLMLEEAFLSFLGFGVQPPYPSFGTLIRQGMSLLDVAPTMALLPLGVLTMTTLGLQLLSRRGEHDEGA